MKITCTFESLEEFRKYIKEGPMELPKEPYQQDPVEVMTGPAPYVTAPSVPAPEAHPHPVEEQDRITDPELIKKFDEETAKQKEAREEKAAEAITEDYRVLVRKTLAALNKKTGKNTASELIKACGVAKLTEVKLDDLPKLMKQAEEALNA